MEWFTEKNSAYSLSPTTIATNMDKDFATLHPKQLRRVVLGPFYSAGITENNSTVAEVLSKVRRQENAWRALARRCGLRIGQPATAPEGQPDAGGSRGRQHRERERQAAGP